MRIPADPAHGAETLAAPVPSIPAASSGVRPLELIGQRYEILGLIGAGGMGTVYRARDVELDEVVALKMLRREIAEAEGILERFRREAKLARRVTHRNVARVFDIGEHGGERFLTMEFVDGESLAALLARERALPMARALEIVGAVCAGVGAAHAAGVVHRDLKPDNVILARDGRVVVTDFGIARAFDAASPTQTTGLLVGTPAYMAPEQVEGRPDIDARADIYALGVLLYEMMTGRRPWEGESPLAVAAQRLVVPPPDPRSHKPDLAPACAQLILRCMARRPEDRPASIEQIAGDLSLLTLPAMPSLRPPPSSGAAVAVEPALPSAGPAQSHEKTVAVLPFRNGGPPEDEYLADELTDDLIDSLSMTRGLRVRSRGFVVRLRGTDRDPRDLGRDLGVQVVVDGSVRRAAGHVRISARLISVADGFQLWAKRFDRPEKDVLTINDEAAKAIADALTVDLAPARRDVPSDPAAIDLFLRARHEYRKFWPDSQRRAIELFDRAAALAPSDATILSGLAMARARLCFFVGEGYDEALGAALRAVSAAPDLGEAMLALASVQFQLGEPAKAVRELRRALAKSPTLAEAHVLLGRILVEVGAHAEGVPRLEAALALDPLVPLAAGTLGRAYALLGRWDEVDPMLQKSLETEGVVGYWTTRARTTHWRGDKQRAIELLAELTTPDKYAALPRALLEFVAHGTPPHDDPAFQQIARGPEGSLRRRAFIHQIGAEIFTTSGDRAAALDALERSADAGLIDLLWLDLCPSIALLRDDPRYAAVRARIEPRAAEVLAAFRAG